MKLLFDQNLSFKLVRLLNMERSDDRAVWEYAKTNGFAIVSLDADFADMSALFGSPPKLIWLRCGNRPTADIEKLLRGHAPVIAEFERDKSVACCEIY